MGARQDEASVTIGPSARTVARWRAEGGGKDGRRDAGAVPAHKLSEVEKAAIVAHATSSDFGAAIRDELATVAVSCPKEENDTAAPALIHVEGKLVGWATFDIAKVFAGGF